MEIQTIIYTKPALISKLKEISETGWIPNGRAGNSGGIGNTLEDLLGIKENNLPIVVFDMDTVGNLVKVLKGEPIGTVVHN